MLSVTNYTTVSSGDYLSLKHVERLKGYFILILTSVTMYLIFIGARFLLSYYKITELPSTVSILADVAKNLTISLSVLEFIAAGSVGIIALAVALTLNHGINKKNAWLMAITSGIIFAVGFLATLLGSALSSYLATKAIEYKNHMDNLNYLPEGITSDQFKELANNTYYSLLVVAAIATILTLASLLITLTSLLAFLQSLKKAPKSSIYSDNDETYIIENAQEESSMDIGFLYCNVDRSYWSSKSRSSSVIQEWSKLLETVNYKKQIRVLRQDSNVLGLILESADGKHIESVSVAREAEYKLPVKDILVQDFMRRKDKSLLPVTKTTIKSNDSKIAHILSKTGWVKDEENSTAKKSQYYYNQ